MTRDYASPDNRQAVFHLIVTFVCYFGAIIAGTLGWGNVLLTAVSVVAFMCGTMRMFGIQHDCGHGSYFTSRKANDIVGVLSGAITANPYYAMQYNHNQHHAYIGNLDRMENHEVLTWTVRQYQDASIWGKLFYRTYRSLPSIFFIGPVFVIMVRYRFPKNALKTGLVDVVVQNLMMAALWGGAYLLGGWPAFAFMALAMTVTICVGVFMVYVGHNHEETYWASGPDVDFEEASLRGSSVIDLGWFYDFMTFNFAYHDLHHLNSRIPAYKLKQCHIDLSDHLEPTRLTLIEVVKCIQWKLWDEEQGKMVRFSDLKQPGLLHPAE
ncbi:fatty acid desaturase family protein [Cognatiyoonia koreensis]|nr:fatty acid desaturase [Cognatiyoonia koreensis]